MYIHSLTISNFQCFRHAQATFQYSGREQESSPVLPNANLLLGINGGGKTALLKAIGLTILSRILAESDYRPRNLVRREPDGQIAAEVQLEAELVLHSQDLDPTIPAPVQIETSTRVIPQNKVEKVEPLVDESAESPWKLLYDQNSPGFLLVGYGATRWVMSEEQFESAAVRRSRRQLRYQRIAGLFEENIGLTPLSAWLPQLKADHPQLHEEAVKLINRLLPEGTRFTGELEDNDYLFEQRGIGLPLSVLSSGYHAYLGWIGDLLFHISSCCSPNRSFQEVRGIVLIDEIDLHLHPSWQRVVVPTIVEALPNLQFLFSTHSPIVAGTLRPENILIMEAEAAGASTVRRFAESIHGLNAEQILLSSYFNLGTTRAPQVMDQLHDLSKRAREGDPDAAIRFLQRLAGGSEDGSSPEEGPATGRRASRKPRK